MTITPLLHVPEEDTPLVRTLVDRSGLGLAEWLGRLLESVLNPLLHLLYRYGIAFSPHGENTILVSDCSEVPSRLAVKDFAADLTISNDPLPERDALPDDLAALVPRRSPAFLCQHIQSGLLICHFRYLSDICEDHFGFPERSFWRLVREYVLAYQERFPAPAERYTTFDMLAPEIERVCLHRNRLLLNGYADRPERPTTPEYGRVRNALAEVR